MDERSQAPKRWPKFSLRTLLVLVTVVAVGVVAKQQWDHWQQLKVAQQWVDAYSDVFSSPTVLMNGLQVNPTVPGCPSDIPINKQIGLLVHGAIHFDGPDSSTESADSTTDSSAEIDRRIVCLKLLAEQFPEHARKPLLKVAIRSSDPDIQKIAIHIVSLYRDQDSVEKLFPLLKKSDRTGPSVRAAIIDLIGLARVSTYPLRVSHASHGDFGIDCSPPIDPKPILFFEPAKKSPANTPKATMSPGKLASPGKATETITGLGFPLNGQFPEQYRERLESIMLGDVSNQERSAAARAMVAWPPGNYKLRYAEWGVWLNSDGQLKLSQELLEEIPDFVHQTGNPLGTFKDRRIAIPMFIFKPVIHLTASHAMAVDLEVTYFQGRPWYAYPEPDDFNLNFVNGGRPIPQLNSEVEAWENLPTMRELDNANLESLGNAREGYPWLLPPHRLHMGYVDRDVLGLGLRWQSLIVSPKKCGWMEAPETTDDPKYKWWEDLRDVDCSWVSNRGESEKFLFYDGPTLANSPLKFELNDSELGIARQPLFEQAFFKNAVETTSKLKLLSSRDTNPRVGFFIEVSEHGAIVARKLDLSGDKPMIELSELKEIKDEKVREALSQTLESAGLKEDEAKGLLDSWQVPFFESPGQRVVFLLRPLEYGVMCQMKCRPAPTEQARVGLVMTELNTK